MKLQVLSSGSAGNGYILSNDTEALIIEAGISLAKAKQVLGFQVAKVAGVLISHHHGDHSKYAGDYEKTFPVYTTAATIHQKKLQYATPVHVGELFEVGNFKIYPFPAEHDVPCLAFVIQHKDIGKMLFLTDSRTCDYQIKGVNHVLIECNYSHQLLNRNEENGLHPKVARRIRESHMELDTCSQVLQEQDLTDVYNIILLHLSENNSDANHFKQYIGQKTGKPVQIAVPGLTVELTDKPY